MSRLLALALLTLGLGGCNDVPPEPTTLAFTDSAVAPIAGVPDEILKLLALRRPMVLIVEESFDEEPLGSRQDDEACDIPHVEVRIIVEQPTRRRTRRAAREITANIGFVIPSCALHATGEVTCVVFTDNPGGMLQILPPPELRRHMMPSY